MTVLDWVEALTDEEEPAERERRRLAWSVGGPLLKVQHQDAAAQGNCHIAWSEDDSASPGRRGRRAPNVEAIKASDDDASRQVSGANGNHTKRNSKNAPKSICITNLGREIEELDLYKCFAPYGAITAVIQKQNEGRAFVTYKDSRVAEIAARTQHMQYLGDRLVAVAVRHMVKPKYAPKYDRQNDMQNKPQGDGTWRSSQQLLEQRQEKALANFKQKMAEIERKNLEEAENEADGPATAQGTATVPNADQKKETGNAATSILKPSALQQHHITASDHDLQPADDLSQKAHGETTETQVTVAVLKADEKKEPCTTALPPGKPTVPLRPYNQANDQQPAKDSNQEPYTFKGFTTLQQEKSHQQHHSPRHTPSLENKLQNHFQLQRRPSHQQRLPWSHCPSHYREPANPDDSLLAGPHGQYEHHQQLQPLCSSSYTEQDQYYNNPQNSIGGQVTHPLSYMPSISWPPAYSQAPRGYPPRTMPWMGPDTPAGYSGWQAYGGYRHQEQYGQDQCQGNYY